MTMRLAAFVFLSALLLLPGLATAQVRITITGGQEKALPIAVVPLQVRGGLAAPDTDIAGVIRADLQRTGLFQPLPTENFVSRPASSEEVRA
jgi:TolB protein